jgi:hypothetical protein
VAALARDFTAPGHLRQGMDHETMGLRLDRRAAYPGQNVGLFFEIRNQVLRRGAGLGLAAQPYSPRQVFQAFSTDGGSRRGRGSIWQKDRAARSTHHRRASRRLGEPRDGEVRGQNPLGTDPAAVETTFAQRDWGNSQTPSV